MVCNCNGLMPPRNGTLDIFFYMGHAVHTAHLRMKMQFHAFFLRIIYSRGRCRSSHDIFCHDIDFLAVFIKLDVALYAQIFALFDLITQFLIEYTTFHKEFYCCRITQVSDIKGNDIFFAFDFLGFHIVDATFYNNRFANDLRIDDLAVIAVDFLAKENAFGNRGRNSCHFCIGFFLYRFCLCGNDFLAQFHQFLFLLLFQKGSLFCRCLYILKLYCQTLPSFRLDHFHDGIIQMLLRQIISHIVFYENLHLAVNDFPFCIRNHTGTDSTLLADKGLNTFPVPFCQLFRCIFFQFVCNFNIHFSDTGQIFQ